MFNKEFNSILEVAREFATEEKCIAHLEELYWQGVPVSPFDETSKVYKCKNGKYRCAKSKKYFTVITNTMMHGTQIPLPKWFAAVYLIINSKKGISSAQLASSIGGISQKSAWFLSMRIKATLGIENDLEDAFEEGSIIEGDETFVGGKNRNRHADKKVKNSQGRSFKDKTPIAGLLQRGEFEMVERPNKVHKGEVVVEKVITRYSKVKTVVVPDTKAESLQPFVKKVVRKDSVLITDEWIGYSGLGKYYDHHIVDHAKKQYVDYDNPEIHSNSMEGFWTPLKRGFIGTYHQWSRKHCQLYADEFTNRFNQRGKSNNERFYSVLLNSAIRTKYRDLTKCLN